MSTPHPPRSRRVIERQCVACRKMQPREALIRLVRQPDGEVALDPDNQLQGRGAYICRTSGCIEQAVRRGGLHKALRHRVPEELMKDVIALGQAMH